MGYSRADVRDFGYVLTHVTQIFPQSPGFKILVGVENLASLLYSVED